MRHCGCTLVTTFRLTSHSHLLCAADAYMPHTAPSGRGVLFSPSLEAFCRGRPRGLLLAPCRLHCVSFSCNGLTLQQVQLHCILCNTAKLLCYTVFVTMFECAI